MQTFSPLTHSSKLRRAVSELDAIGFATCKKRYSVAYKHQAIRPINKSAVNQNDVRRVTCLQYVGYSISAAGLRTCSSSIDVRAVFVWCFRDTDCRNGPQASAGSRFLSSESRTPVWPKCRPSCSEDTRTCRRHRARSQHVPLAPCDHRQYVSKRHRQNSEIRALRDLSSNIGSPAGPTCN
jgi:hypothetical protein